MKMLLLSLGILIDLLIIISTEIVLFLLSCFQWFVDVCRLSLVILLLKQRQFGMGRFTQVHYIYIYNNDTWG